MNARHILKGLAITLTAAQATAEPCQTDDSCYRYAWSATARHVWETTSNSPTKTYVGYTYTNENGNHLAYCNVSSSGTQTLVPLHERTATGTKGPIIPVNGDGEVDVSISICGTNSDNIILGRAAYVWDGEGAWCDDKPFGQLHIPGGKWMRVSGMGGNDDFLGIAFTYFSDFDTAHAHYCGQSGTDYIDQGYGEGSQFDCATDMIAEGGTNADEILESLDCGPREDECFGNGGNDLMVCATCSGSTGTDACSCGTESSCEQDYY